MKGRSIFVEGRLRTRKWQDKDGKDQYSTEIVASEMQMLGSKPNDSDKGAHQAHGDAPAHVGSPHAFSTADADIPF